MDNKATGTKDYDAFWRSMKQAWFAFDEAQAAKNILIDEIAKHSLVPLHTLYPFETKIVEICSIGKKQSDTRCIVAEGKRHREPTLVAHSGGPKGMEYTMGGTDGSFACKRCGFSIKRLKEMAELDGTKEMFATFAGRKYMNIYEVDTIKDYIQMRRATGKLTHKTLSIAKLIHIHNLIHNGQLDLDPHEIDAVACTWGGYAAALLKHLGCRRMV